MKNSEQYFYQKAIYEKEDELLRKLKREVHKDVEIFGNRIIASNLNLNHIPEALNDIEFYTVDLSDNNITSIDGFRQIGKVDLSNNKISRIDKFHQKNYIDLENNQIKSLKGFCQNNEISLKGNPIESFDGFRFNKKYSFHIDFVPNVNPLNKSFIKLLRMRSIKFNLVQNKYNKIF